MRSNPCPASYQNPVTFEEDISRRGAFDAVQFLVVSPDEFFFILSASVCNVTVISDNE